MTAVTIPFLFSLGMIPISLALAYLNRWAIQEHLVDDLWHSFQLAILVSVGIAVFSFIDLDYKYFLLLICSLTHWVAFDTFLNVLRGLNYDYIGYTSTIDKTARKALSWLSEANMRTAYLVIRLWLVFGAWGVYAYLTD